jgi:hypothetical protein
VLPFLAVSLVALCGFLALAIDLGMVMVAKTQAQSACDAAAFAGARSLGGATPDLVKAASNARVAAAANKTLSTYISSANVSVSLGAYHYDPNNQTFTPQFPAVAPDNYSVCQASLTQSNTTAFARVFNLSAFNVSATAIAAHRPTDVCMVLDYSGSMNNESDLWNCETYLGNMINTPNNTDPVFPQWGWYNPAFSPGATLQCTSSDPRVGFCNITSSVLGVPAQVGDYYQNGRGSSGAPAFAPPPATVTTTQPGGDQPIMKNGSSTTPGLTVQDITGALGGSGTASSPYSYATALWGNAGTAKNIAPNGYTQGPGYWGMTFFAWPPDPNNDWRKKYFFLSDGVTPLNSNSALFSASGSLNDPSGNYVINYKAILAWISANCIQQSPGDGRPFPPVLRAGNIQYYNTVPADVPASAYTWSNANNLITDPNQRFWKEYIDFTLGVWHHSLGGIQRPGVPSCSYGPDFQAGSAPVRITGPDSSYYYYKNSSGANVRVGPWISPTDNPLRPRHRFWFGPATLIQYLLDTGLGPGTSHDISMIAAKLGIQGALMDIQNNHPDTLASMLLFARPHFSGEPPEIGVFSQAQVNLTNNYSQLINALWYPPNSSSVDVTPWDPNGAQTPRAHGDYDANTATSYGLMLAYNQFSSNSSLQSAGVGGYGRKGAVKLVILETDGMANVSTNVGFNGSVSNGVNNSYYNLGGNNASLGSNSPATDAINVASKLVAQVTDNTNGPGFATPIKPVIIHCIAFGCIFEPTAQDGQSARAMSLLQSISSLGGTGFPATVTDTSSPYYYKLCIGTLAQRQSKLQTAFTTIIDSTIGIVLVK